MPPRPTRRSDTAQRPVRQARRNYAALAAALLEGMAHDWTVVATVGDEHTGKQRTVEGKITRWQPDEGLVMVVSKMKPGERRGYPTMVFTIGEERVRLKDIVGAKWKDRKR